MADFLQGGPSRILLLYVLELLGKGETLLSIEYDYESIQLGTEHGLRPKFIGLPTISSKREILCLLAEVLIFNKASDKAIGCFYPSWSLNCSQ